MVRNSIELRLVGLGLSRSDGLESARVSFNPLRALFVGVVTSSVSICSAETLERISVRASLLHEWDDGLPKAKSIDKAPNCLQRMLILIYLQCRRTKHRGARSQLHYTGGISFSGHLPATPYNPSDDVSKLATYNRHTPSPNSLKIVKSISTLRLSGYP